MAITPIVRPTNLRLEPDHTRMVLRPFHVEDPLAEGETGGRTDKIVQRILALSDHEVQQELDAAEAALSPRHFEIDKLLDTRFAELQDRFGERLSASQAQARLIGIMFSEEYSIESAALFNPSVVPHFDQSGLAAGDLRIILSARGIGEGHISSLIFQTGVWSADGSIMLDPRELRATGPVTKLPARDSEEREAKLTFPDVPLGERVIYPFLPSQGRGLEDARFCHFVDDDGSSDYRCTVTAFDGMETRQAVFRTREFRHFTGRRLDGDLAFRKGAAWFPRRIDGRYHMLARLDDETICVMASDDPDSWAAGTIVIRPQFPWEFVQMGNCGSPVEIDEGWLLLTHGVGRARRYCIGAALLDRNDPTRLLARTPQPLLEPEDDDRGGYVPNVVYSCGGLVRDRSLLLPYGVADHYCAFATIDVDALMRSME